MLIDTYFKKDDKEKSRSLASRGVREREEGLVTGEMGLRGIIAGVCFDGFDKEEAEKCDVTVVVGRIGEDEFLIQQFLLRREFALVHCVEETTNKIAETGEGFLLVALGINSAFQKYD